MGGFSSFLFRHLSAVTTVDSKEDAAKAAGTGMGGLLSSGVDSAGNEVSKDQQILSSNGSPRKKAERKKLKQDGLLMYLVEV